MFSHVTDDPCGRAEEVRKEIEYIASVREKAGKLSEQFAEGEIPKRVTHNDTKCNNVLFDRNTKEPIVVIDLDTIMPGMSMYDFADAVRFIANTALEDEPDTSKVFSILQNSVRLPRDLSVRRMNLLNRLKSVILSKPLFQLQ